jgi:serine/threonine protein kinase
MSDESIIGSVIDGYRLLDIIGKGGMGIVYRAEDVALSRIVALKMIAPEMAENETFLKRFRAEARALARVDSPYIVGIHAMRHSEQRFFIVMEYVEGGTLADEIAKGPMPPEVAGAIVRQMLLAFANAHRVGVIHRDIKPRNIMITPAGRVKVTDFGLAKLRRDDDATTATQGGMAGTIRYMAPEQVKNQHVDHRSDLYALGMTLFEMLAGVLPFNPEEGAYAILKRIVEDPVPSPLTLNPEIPEGWARLVERAVAKDPTARYQSADEMLQDVDALLDTSLPPADDSDPSDPRLGLFATPPAIRPVVLAPRRSEPAPAGAAPPPVEAKPVPVAEPPEPASLRREPVPPRREPPPLREPAPPRDESSSVYPPLPPRRQPLVKYVMAGLAGVGVLAVAALLLRALTNDTPTYPTDAPNVVTSRLRVLTSPEGAQVFFNDRPQGLAPVDSMGARGAIRIVARLDGYREADTTVVMEGRDQDVHLRLAALDRPRPRPRVTNDPPERNTPPEGVADPPDALPSGSLRLRAEPAGSIAVVGHESFGTEPLTLPAGTYRVRCSANGMSAEMAVTVVAGAADQVTCFTEHTISIATRWAKGPESPSALVVLNGVSTGENVPGELAGLASGRYRITLRKFGFRIEEGEVELELKPVFDRPQASRKLVFTLAEEGGL